MVNFKWQRPTGSSLAALESLLNYLQLPSEGAREQQLRTNYICTEPIRSDQLAVREFPLRETLQLLTLCK